MEHARTETHQFCDSELCMVIDIVTGKPERIFKACNAIGKVSDALEWFKIRADYFGNRYVIVKMNCIQAFKLEASA